MGRPVPMVVVIGVQVPLTLSNFIKSTTTNWTSAIDSCPISSCYRARVEFVGQSDVAVHVKGGETDIESAE